MATTMMATNDDGHKVYHDGLTATAMKTSKTNGVLLRNCQIHSEFRVLPSSENMSVAVMVCGRHGLWPSWFVAIMVCGRHCRTPRKVQQSNKKQHKANQTSLPFSNSNVASIQQLTKTPGSSIAIR